MTCSQYVATCSQYAGIAIHIDQKAFQVRGNRLEQELIDAVEIFVAQLGFQLVALIQAKPQADWGFLAIATQLLDTILQDEHGFEARCQVDLACLQLDHGLQIGFDI